MINQFLMARGLKLKNYTLKSHCGRRLMS